MVEQLDLVMWVKNGAWCLPPVLRRIELVIPRENQCCKILVDDGSTDQTAAIAHKYGWKVISTKGLGVGRAAQIALDHVDTAFYCSFEQDVLLHPQWFKRLLPQIQGDARIGVIQGMRISSLKPMRVLEQWHWRRVLQPISIDNNIYRTEAVRRGGGYPSCFFAGVDSGLYTRIEKSGYKWLVDRSLVSLHLRRSLSSDVKRLYRYHTMGQGEAWRRNPESITKYARQFLTSPLRGLTVGFEFRYLPIFIIYPVMRFYSYKGFIDSARAESRRLLKKYITTN